MRICLRTVDFPLSPAPARDIYQLCIVLVRDESHTEQEYLDFASDPLLVFLEGLLDLSVASRALIVLLLLLLRAETHLQRSLSPSDGLEYRGSMVWVVLLAFVIQTGRKAERGM